MSFRNLNQDDGLTQSTVNAILQDSRGYLWLATEGGLNRYDGVEFHGYLSGGSAPGSLPGEFIWSLAEDAAGDLWLATRSRGLVRWQRRLDQFERRLPPGNPRWDGAQQSRSLLIDRQGQLWLGTQDGGLLQLDGDGQPRTWHARDEAGRSTLGTLYALHEDSDGRILIGSDQGLWQLDPQRQQLTSKSLRWPVAGDVAVSSILRSRDGALWLGSFEHGALRIDADGEQKHFAAGPGALKHPDVRALLEDRQGRIWVATQGGLHLYQPHSGQFARYQQREGDAHSLADNQLMSLAEDANGLLWIGSRIGGVDRWNPRSWMLGAQRPDSLAGSPILAISDAQDGGYWVGGFGAPLQRFATDGVLQAQFSPQYGYPDRGASPVTALLRDRSGHLWIGSFDAGLQRYQPDSKRLEQLRHDPQRADSLGADGIMSLLQTRDGAIWAGSFGGGLARISSEDLVVERIAAQTLGQMRITALAEDQLQQLWIASDGDGLWRYQPASGQLKQLADSADSTFYALHSGPSGHLWIGSADSGLHLIEPDQLKRGQPQWQPATLRQPLPSQTINGIRSDTDGLLWLSTNRGLVRYAPVSGDTRVFHRDQGLVSEELSFGAHHASADGRLCFGGHGGYNCFDPARLNQDAPSARLILTRFEIFNRPLDQARPFSDLQQIRLAHDDDVITFGYALLDFAAPDKNRYSVKLQGFDRDWSPYSRHSRSTYTNLDPGRYTLNIRAISSTGVETREPLAVAIEVQTAPWATPWARAAYLLSAILLLIVLYRWRIRVAQREARIEYLAHYDQITGLPNRNLFESRTNQALQDNGRDDGRICVLVAHIGPLKNLHDSLGYHPSNEVLRSLSDRLHQALFGQGQSSARHMLARLGEESFVMALRLQRPDSEALRWAEKLRQLIAEPLEFGEHKVQVPAQFGIACAPDHGEDAGSLVTHAETAAHETAASNQISFYEPRMTERARERLALESELRQAIRDNQLQLFLQGKFDTGGQLIGSEALCRWTHPQRGPISPAVFVPLAEESDLIMALDSWVIDQAYARLHHWQQHASAPLSIAINISAETFVSGHVFEALERNRERYQVDPRLLEIEVTESVLASDMNLITDALTRIKAMGHLLSLDDFGTGYSSLTYLQQFPIDKLKIDQAFVRDLEHQSEQLSLCKAIVALARSLHLKTIAEGVETARQQEILTEIGCDTLQGFLLHKPQDADGFQARFLSSVPRNS